MSILSALRRFVGRTADVYVPKDRTVSDREAVWANPERYTRASRRAAGYLKPVWHLFMRAQPAHSDRVVRRNIERAMTASRNRRARKARARIARVWIRQGIGGNA